MSARKPFCATCERSFGGDVVQAPCSLCEDCSAFEPLVNAFREGQDNLRAAAEKARPA